MDTQSAGQGERVPVTLQVLIGAGHGGPAFGQARVIEEMKEFLRKSLRRAK